jgi:hypothetical protein
VVSMTVPYGRILDFLDQSHYYSLSSSYSVVLTRLSGPVTDQLLVRKSVSIGNQTKTSRSVAKNSDH